MTIDEYSKEYVQRIIDSETGTKANVPKHSIDWFEEHILYQLKIHSMSEKTIELYKLSFRHLKDIYGGGFSIHKIDREVAGKLKAHLHDKGINKIMADTYLRQLRASFERILNELSPTQSIREFKIKETLDKIP